MRSLSDFGRWRMARNLTTSREPMPTLRSRMKKSRCELHDTPQTMLGTIVNSQVEEDLRVVRAACGVKILYLILYKLTYMLHVRERKEREAGAV
jgi:hypothetical protein